MGSIMKRIHEDNGHLLIVLHRLHDLSTSCHTFFLLFQQSPFQCNVAWKHLLNIICKEIIKSEKMMKWQELDCQMKKYFPQPKFWHYAIPRVQSREADERKHYTMSLKRLECRRLRFLLFRCDDCWLLFLLEVVSEGESELSDFPG